MTKEKNEKRENLTLQKRRRGPRGKQRPSEAPEPPAPPPTRGRSYSVKHRHQEPAKWACACVQPLGTLRPRARPASPRARGSAGGATALAGRSSSVTRPASPSPQPVTAAALGPSACRRALHPRGRAGRPGRLRVPTPRAAGGGLRVGAAGEDRFEASALVTHPRGEAAGADGPRRTGGWKLVAGPVGHAAASWEGAGAGWTPHPQRFLLF